MKLQKGFTLLEVMIAVVVAGIALLGLAAAQLKSLQYATNSFNYTVSLIQAQNTIEQILYSLPKIKFSMAHNFIAWLKTLLFKVAIAMSPKF